MFFDRSRRLTRHVKLLVCVFITVDKLTAVFSVPCPLLQLYFLQTKQTFLFMHIIDLWMYVTQ